jgi:hypothetical protein
MVEAGVQGMSLPALALNVLPTVVLALAAADMLDPQAMPTTAITDKR